MSETEQSQYGAKPDFKWIEIDLLQVDKRYQRDISEKSMRNVRQIAANFKWAKFQTLIVSGPDKIGDYLVIDGQHRLEAAKMVHDIDAVPCVVVEAPEVQDQAHTFVGINKNRTAVTSPQRFWAEIAANDKDALAIKAVCDEAGVKIGRHTNTQTPGQTIAIGALKSCLRLDRKALLRALTNLKTAQGDVPGAFNGQVITALTLLHTDQNTDDQRMVEILRERDLETDREEARRFKKSLGGKTDVILAKTIARAYNKGRSQQNHIFKEGGSF